MDSNVFQLEVVSFGTFHAFDVGHTDTSSHCAVWDFKVWPSLSNLSGLVPDAVDTGVIPTVNNLDVVFGGL